jgi:hypothetical protein
MLITLPAAEKTSGGSCCSCGQSFAWFRAWLLFLFPSLVGWPLDEDR